MIVTQSRFDFSTFGRKDWSVTTTPVYLASNYEGYNWLDMCGIYDGIDKCIQNFVEKQLVKQVLKRARIWEEENILLLT
jgi:hypothetical protein